MEICPKCGLPIEACVCKELEKKTQKITIRTYKRKFGKWITEVSGIESDIKEIAKQLKTVLACGGTIKNKVIELQGQHAKQVKAKLIELGFKEENIQCVTI